MFGLLHVHCICFSNFHLQAHDFVDSTAVTTKEMWVERCCKCSSHPTYGYQITLSLSSLIPAYTCSHKKACNKCFQPQSQSHLADVHHIYIWCPGSGIVVCQILKAAPNQLMENDRYWCKETGMAAARATMTAEPGMALFAWADLT